MRVTKEFSKVDENGFWFDTIRLRYDEESIPNPAPDGYVEAPKPSGFYKPKWDGAQWTEGAPQEEIEQIEQEKELERMQSTEVRMTNAEDTILDLLLKA